MEKKLYTITVFSENTVGLLGQITIIFTRRALNIETLSVSQSAIEGIHKFTITLFSTKDVVEKVVKQIDKRIDILKSYYNTDEDLVYQEIALYKVATDKLLALGSIENWIRDHNTRILEMNEDFVVFQKAGQLAGHCGIPNQFRNSLAVATFVQWISHFKFLKNGSLPSIWKIGIYFLPLMVIPMPSISSKPLIGTGT